MLMEIRRSAVVGRMVRQALRTRQADPAIAERARRRVAAHLEGLRGVPQKIGQLFSLSQPGDPEAVFSCLTEGPGSLPFESVCKEIERGLGRSIDSAFRELSPEGIGASIGQVHRGVLHDGRRVAVKVQYPGLARAMNADLAALGLLAAPLRVRHRAFDVASYRRVLAQALAEELDYRLEAERTRQFAALTGDCPGVRIPDVVDALSSETVLTTTWLEGESFHAVHGWSAAERAEVGRILVRLFVDGCLVHHLVHADPNPGNYRFARLPSGEVQVGLLDFGCVREIPPNVARGLLELIALVRAQGDHAPSDRVLEAFAQVGFDRALLHPMQPRLPALAKALLAPFCAEAPVDATQLEIGERAAAILGDEFRWNFRLAGPGELLFLMRSYRGLLGYLRRLGVPVDWGHEVVRASDDTLPPRGDASMGRRVGWGGPTEGGARLLRVRVSEAGTTKVDLTFRAAVVAHLEDLIPEELTSSLERRGIDVEAIGQASLDAGVTPGALFSLDEDGKEVRVWLE